MNAMIPSPEAAPVLEIEGLTKVFGGLRAVSNFDLRVEKGALDGLIGPNGAGKTTVFNMISGLYVPTEGAILLNGEHTVGLEPFEITNLGVGRTFQNIRLFPNLTVLDNVRIAYHPHAGYSMPDGLMRNGKFNAKERELTDAAQDFLAIFGLDRIQDEVAKNLPYGEQRRLEIARALASRPQTAAAGRAGGRHESERDRPADGVHSLHPRSLQPDHPADRAPDAPGDEYLREADRDGLRADHRTRQSSGDPGQPASDRSLPGPRRVAKAGVVRKDI